MGPFYDLFFTVFIFLQLVSFSNEKSLSKPKGDKFHSKKLPFQYWSQTIVPGELASLAGGPQGAPGQRSRGRVRQAAPDFKMLHETPEGEIGQVFRSLLFPRASCFKQNIWFLSS